MHPLLPSNVPPPSTRPELERAFERSGLARTQHLTFAAAIESPLMRAALELGAAIARKPRPTTVDIKRRAAGDFDL